MTKFHCQERLNSLPILTLLFERNTESPLRPSQAAATHFLSKHKNQPLSMPCRGAWVWSCCMDEHSHRCDQGLWGGAEEHQAEEQDPRELGGYESLILLQKNSPASLGDGTAAGSTQRCTKPKARAGKLWPPTCPIPAPLASQELEASPRASREDSSSPQGSRAG